MLRIHRTTNDGVNFSLSGRIEIEDVAELQRLLDLETAGQSIVFDLREVTLAVREGVNFLARCEADSIRLDHCPGYIREWIDTEKNQSNRKMG